MLTKEHKQQVIRSFELINDGAVSVVQFQDANVVMLTKTAFERLQNSYYQHNIENIHFDAPDLPYCN